MRSSITLVQADFTFLTGIFSSFSCWYGDVQEMDHPAQPGPGAMGRAGAPRILTFEAGGKVKVNSAFLCLLNNKEVVAFRLSQL
ncbi:hypothetical protein [Leisingera sp. ANG59]|uniref:hypothetical protein n=1 Tax=Leisingera sp. ANG59 TaxID=2675221 RepID=UPI001573E97F|nr:hypothetical protein [Leisingera sp. ANG59]